MSGCVMTLTPWRRCYRRERPAIATRSVRCVGWRASGAGGLEAAGTDGGSQLGRADGAADRGGVGLPRADGAPVAAPVQRCRRGWVGDRPGAGRVRRLTEGQRSQIVGLVGAPAPGRLGLVN